MRASPRYTTEAELCADFIAEAEREGLYRCYPETAGWDILAVRVSDGLQIGIQAKLKLNGQVVQQAIEDQPYFYPGSRCQRGPDLRGVLVPEIGGAFPKALCAYLGLTVIRIRQYDVWRSGKSVDVAEITPTLPGMKMKRYGSRNDAWMDLCPSDREKLPDFVPDSAAGSPCPITLTPWKIAAIKMAILLKRRVVTRSDFQALKLDHRRWLPGVAQWMVLAGERGRGWIAGPGLPDFAKQHPRNYAEIEAAADDWLPSPTPLGALLDLRLEALL